MYYASSRRRRCTKILALNRMQENLRDNFVFGRTVYLLENPAADVKEASVTKNQSVYIRVTVPN